MNSADIYQCHFKQPKVNKIFTRNCLNWLYPSTKAVLMKYLVLYIQLLFKKGMILNYFYSELD